MKLRDLASGDGTGRKLIEVGGGLEVIVDKYMPPRSLWVFDDVAVVSSFDDEIEQISRYPFPLRPFPPKTFPSPGLSAWRPDDNAPFAIGIHADLSRKPTE